MNKIEQHHQYDPLKRVIESIHECFEITNEIRDGSIVIPDWEMTIKPQVEQFENNFAVIGFRIFSPDFDEPLYECCASTGKDGDTAIGSCVGSFLFAFMNGIAQMKNDENGKPLTSSFNGKTHTWKVYGSDLVGMGENVNSDKADTVTLKYWDMLKDEIVKRLGNRKMCYVKIFASHAVGKDDKQVIGEVRINDVPSRELSEVVKKHAEKWNVRQFASQKQFFFIKQENAQPCPYSGVNGRALLKSRVKTALEIFKESKADETLQGLREKLENSIGDVSLANECFSFLPEICAEHAFPQVQYPEIVQILIDGGKPETFYRNQLAEFYPIGEAMFELFSSGVFGEETNDIYRKLIARSATYSGISQHQNNGENLEDLATTALIFSFPSDFEIR